MSKFEIIYDYDNGYTDERNIVEIFEGDRESMQLYLRSMKRSGCYNIDVNEISE